MYIYLVITTATATKISAEVGETWIKWSWDYPEGGSVDVYINGNLYESNTTMSSYYLSGANANEKYTLTLYNSSNPNERIGGVSTKTIYPKTIIYLLVGVLLILVVIMLLCTDPIKTLVIGGVTVTLAIYTSTVAIGYGGLYILPMVICSVSGAIIAMTIFDNKRDV